MPQINFSITSLRHPWLHTSLQAAALAQGDACVQRKALDLWARPSALHRLVMMPLLGGLRQPKGSCASWLPCAVLCPCGIQTKPSGLTCNHISEMCQMTLRLHCRTLCAYTPLTVQDKTGLFKAILMSMKQKAMGSSDVRSGIGSGANGNKLSRLCRWAQKLTFTKANSMLSPLGSAEKTLKASDRIRSTTWHASATLPALWNLTTKLVAGSVAPGFW